MALIATLSNASRTSVGSGPRGGDLERRLPELRKVARGFDQRPVGRAVPARGDDHRLHGQRGRALGHSADQGPGALYRYRPWRTLRRKESARSAANSAERRRRP
jgi:hypothetical protein